MKKIILVLMAMVTIPMLAQTWGKKIIEGDNLKGTIDQVVSVYNEGTKTFFFSTVKDNYFLVRTSESFFNFSSKTGERGNYLVNGIIGQYDSEDKLLERIDILFEVDDNHGQTLHPNKYTQMGGNNLKRCKKVLDFIKNEKGYIRIILPLYNDSEFDLKIPTLHSFEGEIVDIDNDSN